jgi:hypothetical protein
VTAKTKRVLGRFVNAIFTFAVLAIVIGVLWPGPETAEFRLDTGDLRYLRFGIPYWVDRMPDPYRSELLAAALASGVPIGEWHRCASYPLPTSNSPDAMCQGFYLKLIPWLRRDKALGLAIQRDIARYIKTTDARRSLPACFPLLMASDSLVIDKEPFNIHLESLTTEELSQLFAEMNYTPTEADAWLTTPQSAAPSPARSGP